MELAAPAKINLWLRVLGRRADGYHELDTLMAPVAIEDRLRAEPADAFAFRCSDPSLPAGEENLVVKAARCFFRETGREARVALELRKEIPSGAGLGGGSSDATCALLLLDRFFGTGLGPQRLAKLAAEVGSDVPFFLAGGPARCRGRGEIVEPCPLEDGRRILLVKPLFAVPTPWAYSRWKDAREIPGVRYAPQDLGWVQLVNDLERPVFEKYQQLAALKMWLLGREEVAGALLSGSGSTVFAVLRDGVEAAGLAGAIAGRFGESFWVRGTGLRGAPAEKLGDGI